MLRKFHSLPGFACRRSDRSLGHGGCVGFGSPTLDRVSAVIPASGSQYCRAGRRGSLLTIPDWQIGEPSGKVILSITAVTAVPCGSGESGNR